MKARYLWLVICDRQQPMTNNTLKTIVFVNPVGAIGGAERALLTIMAALRKAQPNLKLHLIVGTDGALVETAQNLGVQVKVLKLPDQLNQLGDSALKGNRPLEKIQRTPPQPSPEKKSSSSAISPKRGEREGWRGSKISSLRNGGIEGGKFNFCNRADRAKFQSLKELPESKTSVYRIAAKTTNLQISRLSLLVRVVKILPRVAKYLQEFRQAIREIEPDLIHSNGIKTHLLTALAGSINVPVVWHIHDFYGSRPLMAQVLRWISKRATAGIAISEAVERDARATLPGLPIEVIYNSVDVNYFSPALVVQEGLANLSIGAQISEDNQPFPNFNSLSDTLTSPLDAIRVGLVATFARWKGHDVFLEAASQIIAERPNLKVHFYIIGGAIYQTQGSQFSEAELRELASELKITDKVSFMGFQQNIAEVYRWLDIVVHASTEPEPFGLAIVEAMACGKPVIVSQAGGAAELFTHNSDAVGVPPGDRISLVSAIQHLIDNPDLRQSLSENARHTVLKRFSPDRLGEQIFAVYKKLKAF